MSEQTNMRFEFLDVLRGVAILMVLLLHFSERGIESNDQLVHARVWPVLQHGYLGVQLFFVVSGYCITAALYGGFDKSHSMALFVKRRVRRIFPPYWASMLLVVAMGLATIMLLRTPPETVFPLAPWEWAANLVLLQGPLQAHDANLVYWSLSIEIQFYVLMALGVVLGKNWTEVWLAAISVATTVALSTHWIGLTGWVFNYWHEFACGIAAFYWITGKNRFPITPWLLLGLPLLTAALTMSDYDSLLLPNGRFIPAVKWMFCAALSLAFVCAQPVDEWLMSHRLSRWLATVGMVSYSLYLTHVPIGTRIFNLGERITGLGGTAWVLYFGLSMVVSLLFGFLFFRYCERPWLNTPRKAGTPSAQQPNVAVQPEAVTV